MPTKSKSVRAPVLGGGEKPTTPNARGLSNEQAPNEDVAFVWGKRDDGAMNILRKRQERIEVGTVQPLKEGVPIHGEVIQLKPRADSPLYDVEVHLPAPSAPATIPRPAQVATDSYRNNWDKVYRRRRRPSEDKVLN